MTDFEAKELQKALGDRFEVFKARDIWLVRRRGDMNGTAIARADELYRQVMNRADETTLNRISRVGLAEARPVWNDLLAGIPGLEEL